MHQRVMGTQWNEISQQPCILEILAANEQTKTEEEKDLYFTKLRKMIVKAERRKIFQEL